MKTTIQKLEKRRPWVAKYFTCLFLLAGLLITTILGLVPYCLFFSAPHYALQPSFAGFGVARNTSNIVPSWFVVGVAVDPPELWFQYFFEYSMNGTYNFLFIFPFKIINKIRASENMHFNSTSRGSAIWLQYKVNDVPFGWAGTDIWGDFSIENTFKSGTRGSYMFILPFGRGISGEVLGNLQEALQVTFHTPDTNISLQVGLPARYQITQAFPPISAGPNVWTTPSNRVISTVEWQFETLQDSVTIYCQDPDEIALYQSYQFISGLGFGIGVTMVTTTVYDAIKDWVRPSRRRK